jgi:hypothetical protein
MSNEKTLAEFLREELASGGIEAVVVPGNVIDRIVSIDESTGRVREKKRSFLSRMLPRALRDRGRVREGMGE